MPKGKPNKKHTGEFKQKVIETMYKEKLAEMIANVKAQIKAEKEKMTGGPKKSPLSKFASL